jgi:hypothetical protein
MEKVANVVHPFVVDLPIGARWPLAAAGGDHVRQCRLPIPSIATHLLNRGNKPHRSAGVDRYADMGVIKADPKGGCANHELTLSTDELIEDRLPLLLGVFLCPMVEREAQLVCHRLAQFNCRDEHQATVLGGHPQGKLMHKLSHMSYNGWLRWLCRLKQVGNLRSVCLAADNNGVFPHPKAVQ